MHLSTYLDLLQTAETSLAGAYREVARGHAPEPDVHYTCQSFADQCEAHAERLAPIRAHHEGPRELKPERLHALGLTAARSGPIGLLRDLQDLYQLASLIDITWTLVGQAGQGARDNALLEIVAHCDPETEAQLAWLRMRMKAEAPQALLVAS